MKKILTSMLVVLTLSACATDPNNPDSKVGQGTAEGAAAGALGGVLICAVAGCKTDGYLAAGAIGGVVGGVVGNKLASDVEARRKALAGKENNLDARLTFVRGVNEDTEKFNGKLRSDLAALQQQIDSGNRSTQTAVARQKQVDGQLATAKQQIASYDSALNDMKRYRAQPSTPASPALDSEISRLEVLLAETRSNTSSLASLRQRI